MREIFKMASVLIIVTSIVAGLLGITDANTRGRIKENELNAIKSSMEIVMSDFEGVEFGETIPVIGFDGVSAYTECTHGGAKIGYVIEGVGKGFAGEIKILVGITLDGIVSGVNVVLHNETPGLGAHAASEKFLSQFAKGNGHFRYIKSGSPSTNEISAITAATVTTNVVTMIVNHTLDFYNNKLK